MTMHQSNFEPTAYLEPVEARAIIASAASLSRHPERDTLLLECLWQTGGRKTEVLRLTPERISNASLALDNLKQRHKGTVKETYVAPALCAALKDYCKRQKIGQGMLVFQPNRPSPKQLDPSYVWRLVVTLAEANGIYKLKRRDTKTGKPKFKPAWTHLFRHGCAMHILDQTGSTELTQHQLGHAQITTTQGYAVLKQDKARKGLGEINW